MTSWFPAREFATGQLLWTHGAPEAASWRCRRPPDSRRQGPFRLFADGETDTVDDAGFLGRIEKSYVGMRGPCWRASSCVARCRDALDRFLSPKGEHMKRSEFRLEFITPCFLGGATSSRNAEWRAASIRGQLRWWLRAVAGGATAGDQVKVARIEEQLFGSSNVKGALRLAVTTPSGGVPVTFDSRKSAGEIATAWRKQDDTHTVARLTIQNRNSGREAPSNPLAYLGFGAIDHRGKHQRGFIPAGAKASMQIQEMQPLAGDLSRYVQDAIWCWINLGGIGTKSRKGYGSLGCFGDEGAAPDHPSQVQCKTLSDFETKGQQILAEYGRRPAAPLPEWSHFSQLSSIWVATEGRASWKEALEHVGCWLIGFRRRYGNPSDNRTLGGVHLANRDYTWASPAARGARRKAIPDRAGFGLPLPFGNGGETIVRGQNDNRRASPLLIHVSRFSDGARETYHPVFTHLPARLIPVGDSMTFQACSGAVPLTNARHGQIVNDFLEDLAGRKLLRKVECDG